MRQTPTEPMSAPVQTATAERRPQLDPVLTAPPVAAALVRRDQGSELPGRTLEGVRFTPEKVELLKATIAKGASDDELELFMYTCQRLNLDPFARQIYFLKRKAGEDDEGGAGQAGRAQVSIDGLRLIADRTGEYEGQTLPEWARVTRLQGSSAPTVEWFAGIWPFENELPHSARVGIYRAGFREPLYGIARFAAYRVTKRGGSLNYMWTKMGPEQLAKCAEALGLRKAFPQELSGIYTAEEMEQADNEREDERPAKRTRQREQQQREAGEPAPAKAAAPEWDGDLNTGTYPQQPYKGVPLNAIYRAGVKKWRKEGEANREVDVGGHFVIGDKRLSEMALYFANRIGQHEAAARDSERDPEMPASKALLSDADLQRTIGYHEDAVQEMERRARTLNEAAQRSAESTEAGAHERKLDAPEARQ